MTFCDFPIFVYLYSSWDAEHNTIDVSSLKYRPIYTVYIFLISESHKVEAGIGSQIATLLVVSLIWNGHKDPYFLLLAFKENCGTHILF